MTLAVPMKLSSIPFNVYSSSDVPLGLKHRGLEQGERQPSARRNLGSTPAQVREFRAGPRTPLCARVQRSPSSAPGARGLPAPAPASRGRDLPRPLPPPWLRAAAGRGHVSAARRGRGPDFRAAEGDAAA